MKLMRAQLYAMVWEKPMTHLAKEFGLSDVGLAKICKKHGVPLPERGYWAKVEAGIKVPKKALPRKNYNPEIEIQDRSPITQADVLQKQQKKEQAAATIALIAEVVVSPQLDSPHKLTVKTRRYFDDIKKKLERQSSIKKPYQVDWRDRAPSAEYGRYICSAQDGFHLTVSLEALHRALCFLDALAKGLEREGFKIHHDIQDTRGKKVVEAIKDNESIRFHLSEGYKQRILTPQELKAARAEYSYASEYERVPSGIFTLFLKGREGWTEKKFVDGAKKIEERLTAIIAEFIDLVPRQKQTRLDRVTAESERRERERREWEKQWKRQKQKDQYEAVIAEAKQLELLEHLESYLQRIESQYKTQFGEIEENVAAWLNLIRQVAKLNDPLQKRLEYLSGLNDFEPNQLDWMPDL